MKNSNKPTKYKKITTKKAKNTKANSKETNSKATGDENATTINTNTTKTNRTTTATEQVVVIKRNGNGISTMSISGKPEHKEMNRMLIFTFSRF